MCGRKLLSIITRNRPDCPVRSIRSRALIFLFVIVCVNTITPARQARYCGDFSTGRRTLPASLDIYSLRLAYRQNPPAASTLVQLSVNEQFQANCISRLGGVILRREGTKLLISCRCDAVETVAAQKGVVSCSVSLRPEPLMDSVRAQCRINQIHGGTQTGGFSTPYTGKGVLTGILDSEFDTHHPAFLDSSGQTRFFALWDQMDSTGRAKNRFGYGTIKYRSDMAGDTLFGLAQEGAFHGTHTASTMAGSSTKYGYGGAAPDGILVGVRYSGIAQIAEGLVWICSLADSLKLPCVINTSIGLASGPHDGTSLVDHIIDSLSGPGRIIVGAIGNDGARYSHISFNLNPGETKKTWVMPYVDSLAVPYPCYLGADIWGEPGKNFSGSFMIMDRRTLSYRQGVNPFSTSKTRLYAVDTIEWKDSVSGMTDTFFLQFGVERSSERNSKTHLIALAYSTNPHLQLGITITNPSTTSRTIIHGWNTKKESFYHFGLDGFTAGDSTYTVNEIGGTSKRNITVGAYCGRTIVPLWNNTTFNHDNQPFGEIFSSSGVGPTVDGRIKPDIVAPGWSVIAALSRTAPKNWSEVAIWPDTTTTLSRYGGNTGTSMASPVVAGIVALMLQAKPDLTPEEAKEALQKTAVKDGFTGPLAAYSNKWGAGKVDALAALADLLDIPVTTGNGKPPTCAGISVRCRNDRLFINGKTVTPESITVSDLLGRTVLNCTVVLPAVLPLPPALAPGMYVLRSVSIDGSYNGHPHMFIKP